jgi:hypothetical protein
MAFLDVAISEHAEELGKDATARQALLDLAANGVSRQLPTALARAPAALISARQTKCE